MSLAHNRRSDIAKFVKNTNLHETQMFNQILDLPYIELTLLIFFLSSNAFSEPSFA